MRSNRSLGVPSRIRERVGLADIALQPAMEQVCHGCTGRPRASCSTNVAEAAPRLSASIAEGTGARIEIEHSRLGYDFREGWRKITCRMRS